MEPLGLLMKKVAVNINGTVVDFHNKIENGFWVIDDLHVDGQILAMQVVALELFGLSNKLENNLMIQMF